MSKNNNEFRAYFLKDIPLELHMKMKAGAKKRRIPIKFWLREAIKEKLEKENENV